MKIPRELLQKYNRPVPRYTSYPPANYFHEKFSGKDLTDAITRSNQQNPDNISIYIHIPFCNQICHYCGCNSMKLREPEYVERYIKALLKELTLFKKYLSKDRKISQIHWGGGTPNTLSAEQIAQVMNLLKDNFYFAENPEIAMECNPAGLSPLYMDGLKNAGFNRISLGIQDFNEEVLKIVNREIPHMSVADIVAYLKSKSIKVNLDFIYGLPLQTVKSFAKTIHKAIEIGPDRLVTFSYAHVPWIKRGQKILEQYGLPSAGEKTEMFEAAAYLLRQGGYHPIGFDHFARPEDDLVKAFKNKELHRNFQGYCTRETTGQVYAAGVSSISQLHDAYAQNTKNITQYIESLEKDRLPTEKGYKLNKNEIIIRETLDQLMCNLYLNPSQLAFRNNISLNEFYQLTGVQQKDLEEFSKDGLIEINGGILNSSKYGRFFIRNIAAAFDPLQRKNTEHKFSKTV